jgi:hypothetical protein
MVCDHHLLQIEDTLELHCTGQVYDQQPQQLGVLSRRVRPSQVGPDGTGDSAVRRGGVTRSIVSRILSVRYPDLR